MTKHLGQTDASTQMEDLQTQQSSQRISLWIIIVVILGVALTVVGAVIGKVNPTMLTNGGQVTDAVRVYADYLFARNLALAVMVMFLLAIRSPQMLAGFMVLIALVQTIDVVDDLTRGAFVLVPGLLVFAIVFLIAASRLFGQAFWRVEAWRKLGR